MVRDPSFPLLHRKDDSWSNAQTCLIKCSQMVSRTRQVTCSRCAWWFNALLLRRRFSKHIWNTLFPTRTPSVVTYLLMFPDSAWFYCTLCTQSFAQPSCPCNAAKTDVDATGTGTGTKFQWASAWPPPPQLLAFRHVHPTSCWTVAWRRRLLRKVS